MNVLIVILTIISISIALLKFYNIKCCKVAKNVNQIIMMKTTPSYKKFIEISNMSSPPNRPKRESGDFLDYFLEGISNEDELLENNIMTVYGVGGNE